MLGRRARRRWCAGPPGHRATGYWDGGCWDGGSGRQEGVKVTLSPVVVPSA